MNHITDSNGDKFAFDPACKLCHGKGTFVAGYSGREDDGNAPIWEDCECFLPLEIPEGRDSQHVLKAEGESPDATDREHAPMASPDGGPMGAGQAAAAAPAGAMPEPVAFIWHAHLGEKTRSLRWERPTQWDYTESVEPLYTATQLRERDAAWQARVDEALSVLRDLVELTEAATVPYSNDVAAYRAWSARIDAVRSRARALAGGGK